MSDSLHRISNASVRPVFSNHAVNGPKQKKAKRLSPLSLGLSEIERSELERMADGQPLGSYIKNQLFKNSKSIRTPRVQQPSVNDHKSLACVLRALANADTIKTIGDLRAAGGKGTILISDDAEYAIQQACIDIAHMRRNLIVALGLKVEVRNDPRW